MKRQLAKDKPLYIDQILQSRSAIPAVGTRLFALPKETAKDNKGKESRINREQIEKFAKRKLTQAPAKPAKKSKGTAYDVWADEGKPQGGNEPIESMGTDKGGGSI